VILLDSCTKKASSIIQALQMLSAESVAVQEKQAAVLLLPGIVSKSNPFYSPAQVSDISTVADWCSEPDEDVDSEWQSDSESDREADMNKNFPTLQALFDKKVPVSKQVQEWNAVGGRLSATLASCEVDSDEETIDEGLPETAVVKDSITAWSMVGSRLSHAFMQAAEEEIDF
jgi:hypothetical protein